MKKLLKEQLVCHLISPRGSGEGGYMSNSEAFNLINKIEQGGRSEIKDPNKLSSFLNTLKQFRHDIKNADTNLDTVDTYLHKLRDLVGCYNLTEEVDKERMNAVGIVIVSRKTKRFLLLHRVDRPIVWSILTGTMDRPYESSLETIKREIEEEIRVDSSKIQNIKEVGIINNGRKFHVFVGFVNDEFTPDLDLSENDDWGWFTPETLPKPLHSGWPETYELVRPYIELKESVKIKLNTLLNESEGDDLDWIRDVNPIIPFENTKPGKYYNVRVLDINLFNSLLVDCGIHNTFNPELVGNIYVYFGKDLVCDNIFCNDCEWPEGKRFCLKVDLFDQNLNILGLDFWVSDDIIEILKER